MTEHNGQQERNEGLRAYQFCGLRLGHGVQAVYNWFQGVHQPRIALAILIIILPDLLTIFVQDGFGSGATVNYGCEGVGG